MSEDQSNPQTNMVEPTPQPQPADIGLAPTLHGALPPTPAPPPAPKKPLLKLILIGGLLVIVGLAAAVMIMRPGKSKAPKNTALTKVNVHLGWLNQAQFAGFYVAKDKGYYKDAGLDVNIKEFQDGEDINQEASQGKIDFGTSTPLEVIASRDKGSKIKAVAAIYQTSPYCFVSPKSANIKTPSDLKGKALGYVGNNTEAQVAYPALLSSYDISLSQVTVKDVGFDIVKNFQDHAADTADIYRTDQTYLLDKAGIAYNILLPEQFGLGLYGDVIIASDNTVNNRPEVAAKFTQNTMKGFQYALSHQDEALAIIAKYENALYKDPGYEKHILSESAPLIKPTAGQPLGSMQFVPWNKAYEAIKSVGLVKNNIDVSQVYTTQFIN